MCYSWTSRWDVSGTTSGRAIRILWKMKMRIPYDSQFHFQGFIPPLNLSTYRMVHRQGYSWQHLFEQQNNDNSPCAHPVGSCSRNYSMFLWWNSIQPWKNIRECFRYWYEILPVNRSVNGNSEECVFCHFYNNGTMYTRVTGGKRLKFHSKKIEKKITLGSLWKGKVFYWRSRVKGRFFFYVHNFITWRLNYVH